MSSSFGFSTMPSSLIVHGRIVSACAAVEILFESELVEIVVRGVELLVGDRPIERIFLIALDRIEVALGSGINVGNTLGRAVKATSPARWRTRQKIAAAEKDVFGRGFPFRNFPAAAADHMHGLFLRFLLTREVRGRGITGKSQMRDGPGVKAGFSGGWPRALAEPRDQRGQAPSRRRERGAPPELPAGYADKLTFRHRLGVKIALPDIAAERLQLVALVRELDPFRNGLEFEALRSSSTNTSHRPALTRSVWQFTT